MKGLVQYVFVLFGAAIIEALVHVDKLQMCDTSDYAFKFGLKLKDDGDKQIAEHGFLDTKIDLNNDLMQTVYIYQIIDGEEHLILTKTEKLCHIVDTFMGEFAKGLEASAGLKQCPYPKGKFEINNYPLDFSNFKYKDFPPGTVKVKFETSPKGNESKKLSCYWIQFTMTA